MKNAKFTKCSLRSMLCSAFLLFTLPAHAQPDVKQAPAAIKAIVIDSITNDALAYVTIVVKESATNTVVQSFLSYADGTFTLPAIRQEPGCYITLSYVGYKTKSVALPSPSAQPVSLTIALAPAATMLQEVQVSTLKPLIEQRIDKTIYNVEFDPEANVLNALDMLRKMPALSIDADDNLQINSNANVQVLVNGKRSSLVAYNLQEVLKSLPASAIKKVEIITTPSARYEANGVGGIINIITKEERISGYNGTANVTAGTPKTLSGGAAITATAGKLSVSGRYSYGSSTKLNNRNNMFRQNKAQNTELLQVGEGSNQSRLRNVGAEVSYEPSEFDLVTVSVNTNRNRSAHTYLQLTEQLDLEGGTTEAYQNTNDGSYTGIGHDIGVDYQKGSPKNELKKLSLSLNLLRNDNNNTTNLHLQPLRNYTGREAITQNSENSVDYTAQADYTQPAGKQNLEFGVKTISQKNGSDYLYKNVASASGDFMLDPSLSSQMAYRLHIQAAYAALNVQSVKWWLSAGLRLEKTDLSADFKSSGARAKQSYLNLFPSITVSSLSRSNGMLKFSYSQRIERPNLYYINPYIDATDPANISYGNPDLEPSISHILQLEYNKFLKGTAFSAALHHQSTNNAIQQFTTLGGDSVAKTSYGNFGHSQATALNLNGNATLFNKLSMNISGATTYAKYSSGKSGARNNRKGFSYNVNGSVSYRFGKTWRTSSNVNFNSSNILLQGRAGGYFWSSLSLNKQFLKNQKASAILSVTSPFQKYRRNTREIDSQAFYQLTESYTNLRQYSLGVSFRFGKLR